MDDHAPLPPLTKRIKAIQDPAEASRMYVWLSRLAAEAHARLLCLVHLGQPVAPPDGDRMLKADEAARLFGVSRSWLYEHGEELGLARRPEGIRGVRFSERALRRWQEGARRE